MIDTVSGIGLPARIGEPQGDQFSGRTLGRGMSGASFIRDW
jgi:hypothetical protein